MLLEPSIIPFTTGQLNFREQKIKGEEDDRLQRVPQQTATTKAIVQWTVFKTGTGDFDAEAAVSSVGFEIRWEGIQLHSLDVWLNNETGRNKVVMERLQQVPQQTAAPMDLVQRKMIINEYSVKCTSAMVTRKFNRLVFKVMQVTLMLRLLMDSY